MLAAAADTIMCVTKVLLKPCNRAKVLFYVVCHRRTMHICPPAATGELLDCSAAAALLNLVKSVSEPKGHGGVPT